MSLTGVGIDLSPVDILAVSLLSTTVSTIIFPLKITTVADEHVVPKVTSVFEAAAYHLFEQAIQVTVVQREQSVLTDFAVFWNP